MTHSEVLDAYEDYIIIIIILLLYYYLPNIGRTQRIQGVSKVGAGTYIFLMKK